MSQKIPDAYPGHVPPKPIPVARPWAGEYLTLIEDCEKRESRLTEWEASFVDSIRHQMEKEKPLSVKQIETLDGIWERVTAHG